MRRFLTRLVYYQLECMAFGDAENDLDMLSYAGIGVAMGNAPEAVKHAADYVTASVDEKGLNRRCAIFGSSEKVPGLPIPLYWFKARFKCKISLV